MAFGAEFDAIFREMVKDVRQTFNEVMLNHHEHAPEMGAPMSPTPQMVTRELDGFDSRLQAAAACAAPAQEQQMQME